MQAKETQRVQFDVIPTMGLFLIAFESDNNGEIGAVRKILHFEGN